MHCIGYFYCLELLTPTDSESLPWGRWRKKWKEYKRALNSETETVRQAERGGDGGRGTDREWKAVWEEWMRLSDQLHWPCGLLMRQNCWAAQHGAVRSAVLALTLCHAGNSLQSSLISNSCRHRGRPVMNYQGWTMNWSPVVWPFPFCVNYFLTLFIQRGDVGAQVFSLQ